MIPSLNIYKVQLTTTYSICVPCIKTKCEYKTEENKQLRVKYEEKHKKN